MYLQYTYNFGYIDAYNNSTAIVLSFFIINTSKNTFANVIHVEWIRKIHFTDSLVKILVIFKTFISIIGLSKQFTFRVIYSKYKVDC